MFKNIDFGLALMDCNAPCTAIPKQRQAKRIKLPVTLDTVTAVLNDGELSSTNLYAAVAGKCNLSIDRAEKLTRPITADKTKFNSRPDGRFSMISRIN